MAHLTRTRASSLRSFALVLALAGGCASAPPPPGATPGGPAPAAARAPAPVEASPAAASAGDILIVDHAWVPDATGPGAAADRKNAAQRKSMEELRARVLAGQALPEAFKTLPGLENNGADWHVGEREEYPYDVVPAEAHDLPPGGVSPVIAGNGGIHLFKVHGRKPR